jgi:hypothetical protein
MSNRLRSAAALSRAEVRIIGWWQQAYLDNIETSHSPSSNARLSTSGSLPASPKPRLKAATRGDRAPSTAPPCRRCCALLASGRLTSPKNRGLPAPLCTGRCSNARASHHARSHRERRTRRSQPMTHRERVGSLDPPRSPFFLLGFGVPVPWPRRA